MWIEHWEPDNDEFWAAGGERIARKNLILSMLAEHIGFCVWAVWTIVVLHLADNGLGLSVSELFLLTLAPNLVGAVLRIPYTFAVPRFGGRAWTTVSALLLLAPALLLALVVPSDWLRAQAHDTQLAVLLLCAAAAGVGGGNFSSSMANISFFYPDKKKGMALGLNAAGGNLGVAVTQLVVPLVLATGTLAYAGWMWVPLIVLAAALAWTRMDSIANAKADTRSYAKALRHGQTWVMSFLYIGTFGSFIGFSFALPLVIKTTFPEVVVGLGFTGALVGSLSRPLGGWLADRLGGARVTLYVFIGMALAALGAIEGVQGRSFGLFFASFVVLFLLAGMGNGSTYKMIPAVFAVLAKQRAAAANADPSQTALDFKRRAAAVIGVAGAIGALGGVLIQVTIRQASLDAAGAADWSVPAFKVFAASYLVFAAVTWFVYLRTGFAVKRIPSIAMEAAV